MPNSGSSRGYSGTPLVKKLGLKAGMRIAVLSDESLADYRALLGSDAPDLTLQTTLSTGIDAVHIFTASRADLSDLLPRAMAAIPPNGMIWVSWPKKASKVPSDVTEDTVRELCLPLGLVDVKVCAVDAVWSGLKLVIRKELR
ncbi:MAG: DUF3052 family protein [Albidovulum sp.]